MLALVKRMNLFTSGIHTKGESMLGTLFHSFFGHTLYKTYLYKGIFDWPVYYAVLDCRKRLSIFPVPSQNVTNQTLPGRESWNYSRPVLLVTGLGTVKSLTFFYSVEDDITHFFRVLLRTAKIKFQSEFFSFINICMNQLNMTLILKIIIIAKIWQKFVTATVPDICNTKSTYIFSKLKLFFALKFWRTGTGGQETRHYNNYNLYDFMIIFTSKPPHIPRQCDLSPQCQKADHGSPPKGLFNRPVLFAPPPPPSPIARNINYYILELFILAPNA